MNVPVTSRPKSGKGNTENHERRAPLTPKTWNCTRISGSRPWMYRCGVDAREAYLKVIQLDPMNLDARFNLGLLAHSIGADDEARHHLEKLKAMAPQDEWVARLTLTLNAPNPQGPTPPQK